MFLFLFETNKKARWRGEGGGERKGVKKKQQKQLNLINKPLLEKSSPSKNRKTIIESREN